MELMETKYKQTEVGLIPEDWKLEELNQVCSFENGDRGINYPSKSDFKSWGKLFVNAGHLKNKSISLKNMDYISDEKFNQLNGGKFKKDDILFCLRGSLGKFAIVSNEEQGAIASSLIIIRPILKELFVNYLKFYLESRVCENMIEVSAGGAAQPNLGGSELGLFKIPLPPTLIEQKAIATALSDVDDLITSLDKLITKKKAIKQGAMQQLLTPSAEWRKHKLGDTLDFVVDNRGKTPPIQADGYPMVEVNAIYKQGKSPNLQRVIKFVSKETYENWFRDGHPLKGDILIVTVGSAGYTSYVNDREFCIAQNLISLRIKPSYSSEFIFYLTKTDKFKRLVSSVLMGAVQPSLKVPHLNNFEFEFPELDSQNRIAQILSEMDKEIDLLEMKKLKYQDIKKGMMQELLTGKTRLV